MPFTTRYRPIWVGLGIAAAELLVALAVTNHYRRRLTYRFWRRAHYLNFAVWTGATLHGLGSGTDRSSPWLLATFAAAVSAVSATVVWRIGRKRTGTRIGLLACLAAVVAAVVVVGIGRGPLRFKPNPWNAPRFTETLTGHVAQLSGTTRGIVSMAGEGQGHQRVLVRADLLIAPQKLLKTSFQMEYLPSGELCNGTVTAVHPTGFAATCHLRTGERRVVSANWQAEQHLGSRRRRHQRPPIAPQPGPTARQEFRGPSLKIKMVSGRLIVIGDYADAPYERPAVSEDELAGNRAVHALRGGWESSAQRRWSVRANGQRRATLRQGAISPAAKIGT